MFENSAFAGEDANSAHALLWKLQPIGCRIRLFGRAAAERIILKECQGPAALPLVGGRKFWQVRDRTALLSQFAKVEVTGQSSHPLARAPARLDIEAPT